MENGQQELGTWANGIKVEICELNPQHTNKI